MCLNNLTVSRKTSEAPCLLLWPQQTISQRFNLSLILLPYNLPSESEFILCRDWTLFGTVKQRGPGRKRRRQADDRKKASFIK